jgi:hypothetical protein
VDCYSDSTRADDVIVRLPAMSTRAQIASSAALLVAGAALAYGALRFPDAPRGRRARHSLAALGPASPHWAVYPEDFFPGGAYVELPHGRTRYWVFGPEDGKRVRVGSSGLTCMVR